MFTSTVFGTPSTVSERKGFKGKTSNLVRQSGSWLGEEISDSILNYSVIYKNFAVRNSYLITIEVCCKKTNTLQRYYSDS